MFISGMSRRVFGAGRLYRLTEGISEEKCTGTAYQNKTVKYIHMYYIEICIYIHRLVSSQISYENFTDIV